MHKKCMLFLFLVVFTNSSSQKNKKDNTEEVFEPTTEWKVIKEGQKVPAGLHYRINLSTGKKEAKINNEKESPSSQSFSIAKQSKDSLSSDEIETFLKDINKKNPEDDMPKKFRTLDEIKKDLGDLELAPKSDVEVLHALFKKFEAEEKKKQPDDKIIIDILRYLIYIGHQIDNGNEFYKMDGFKKIIYKKLNSTNITVKQEALKLFSTLAQNSPQVKVHILETGGITILLRILTLEDNHYIKNSAMTALSCTLRTFPYAQEKFIESGGLTIFTNLLKTGSIKLKLKLVTLLNDFIVERQNDVANFEKHTFIDIEEALFNLSWCHYLNELLHDFTSADLNDHDSVEKCLLSMKSMVKKCSDIYETSYILNLYEHYQNLAKKNLDDSGDYFKYLSDITLALLSHKKNSNDKEYLKQEL